MNAAVPDPREAAVFRFLGRHFDPEAGEARLEYAFDDGPVLVERLVFPWAPWPQDASRQAAFFRALDLLHLVAGVSYYKAGVPERIDTGDHFLDGGLAGFQETLYTRGLAEFAHVNGLDLDGRVRFPVTGELHPVDAELALPDRALVAMGGGKDSLVSLEILRDAGIEVQPFTVGASLLIADTVVAAGLPLIGIERELAPELADMNAAGAWNGHVPVTAINSAIGLCAALLYGYRWVVFSNEASAEEATLVDDRGRPVNHQYSKSLDFERRFRAVARDRVAPELEYFSLIRALGETAVARRFATLEKYHPVFSSCNRNFHRDGSRIEGRWCGDCPKCRFTSLALAPFLAPEALAAIVGRNLLDDPAQVDGYRALCALGADKPFECVGTAAESRALVAELATRPEWRDRAAVRALAGEIGTPPDALAELLDARGPDCLPAEVADRVKL